MNGSMNDVDCVQWSMLQSNISSIAPSSTIPESKIFKIWRKCFSNHLLPWQFRLLAGSGGHFWQLFAWIGVKVSSTSDLRHARRYVEYICKWADFIEALSLLRQVLIWGRMLKMEEYNWELATRKPDQICGLALVPYRRRAWDLCNFIRYG